MTGFHLLSIVIGYVVAFSTPGFAAQLVVAQNHSAASDENPGTPERPFKSISRALEDVRPGDVIVVHRGVYRETVRLPKGTLQQPITIEAATSKDGRYEEVILSGADVLTDWERYHGDGAPNGAAIWMHRPWTHVWVGWNEDMSHGALPPIGRSEQLIVDGSLLKHVLSLAEMTPGTFFADAKETQTLYARFPNDESPDGHTVEASVRDLLLFASDHTRVRGLTVRYAANRAQQGALRIDGEDIVVEDCLVEWTNGCGVTIAGENFILRRTVSRNNGQLGLGGTGRNFLVEVCVFEANNLKGFSPGWEAGGFKIVRSWGAKIERCQALGNHGPGMWFDIDNFGGEVRQNVCADNDNSGIFIEISGDFLVTDNLCVNNGGRTKGDWAGAGISLGESRDCYVAFNTCVANQYGISIRGQVPRKVDDRIYKDRNITIRNNALAYNRIAGFGLMWDAPFMGRHPGERELSEQEWQERLKDSIDPDAIGLMLDYNIYAGGDEVVRWGVSWRPKWTAYTNLERFATEYALERHGEVTEPGFVDWRKGDFRLRPDSPLRSADGYIRAGLRYSAPTME